MATRFHHVNICSERTPDLDSFYRKVIGMEPIPGREEGRVKDVYANATCWITDGAFELHLSAPDYAVGFETGHIVNPLARGHIGFRTDDLDEVKSRLDSMGLRYSDYGAWAMGDWRQLFLYDPAGNVVEISEGSMHVGG